jgi:uncharacterized protein with PIN domain
MLAADPMLGWTAKWLRLLGYDMLYWRGDDARLVRLVLAENRLLLTRDTRIPPWLPLHLTFFINSDHDDKQLAQVVARLGLPPPDRLPVPALQPSPLEPTDKAMACVDIPASVWQTRNRFARCPGSRQVWRPVAYTGAA